MTGGRITSVSSYNNDSHLGQTISALKNDKTKEGVIVSLGTFVAPPPSDELYGGLTELKKTT
ncbi:hypothetical protein [Vibrio coralliirubri]|uniref:hypothetical protein n=1 Tax=Vibrio coralliirubri TaxID=1516159 RepID=UPI000A37376E|nr:hypothetical protein [Vibrio coralliirubri]